MWNGQPPGNKWLTSKGRHTRARIVDAAADLFARHGVAGTSVEDVRRAAGVSGSQITHYFGGKQGLVRAVIGLQAEAVLESLTRSPFGSPETLSDLLSWTDGTGTTRQRPGSCFGALAGELIETDPETREELAQGFEKWVVLLRAALEEMRQHGTLRRDADPGTLAYGLLAAFHGGTLVARTVQSSEPLEAAMSAMLAHIASFRGTDLPGEVGPAGPGSAGAGPTGC